MTTPDGDRAEPTGAESALGVALWRHSEQFRAIEGADQKIERVLTLAVAIAGLFALAVTFTVENAERNTVRIALVSGIPVAIAFAFVLGFFFKAFWTSRWRAGPSGDDVINVVAQGYPEPRVQLWLLEEVIASIDENRKINDEKTKWATLTVIATVTQSVIAGLALALIALAWARTG